MAAGYIHHIFFLFHSPHLSSYRRNKDACIQKSDKKNKLGSENEQVAHQVTVAADAFIEVLQPPAW